MGPVEVWATLGYGYIHLHTHFKSFLKVKMSLLKLCNSGTASCGLQRNALEPIPWQSTGSFARISATKGRSCINADRLPVAPTVGSIQTCCHTLNSPCYALLISANYCISRSLYIYSIYYHLFFVYLHFSSICFRSMAPGHVWPSSVAGGSAASQASHRKSTLSIGLLR